MGGGLTPPPPLGPGFHQKNEILQKEISVWLFLVHKLWTFGFQDPPPPEENSG